MWQSRLEMPPPLGVASRRRRTVQHRRQGPSWHSRDHRSCRYVAILSQNSREEDSVVMTRKKHRKVKVTASEDEKLRRWWEETRRPIPDDYRENTKTVRIRKRKSKR